LIPATVACEQLNRTRVMDLVLLLLLVVLGLLTWGLIRLAERV
jgi:cell division protein FtsB